MVANSQEPAALSPSGDPVNVGSLPRGIAMRALSVWSRTGESTAGLPDALAFRIQDNLKYPYILEHFHLNPLAVLTEAEAEVAFSKLIA